MTDDLISRAEAMDASEKFIKDCNPDHFVGHQKFIEYMDNAEIGSFGKWQFANGFNMGLTAAEVAIKELPSAQREHEEFEWCTDCKEYDQTAYCCHRWTKVIRKTVEELKRPQWIPCSERMPEFPSKSLWVNSKGEPSIPQSFRPITQDDGPWQEGYIVCSKSGKVFYSTWYASNKKSEPHWTTKAEVIAWMPLPEPYKEEE